MLTAWREHLQRSGAPGQGRPPPCEEAAAEARAALHGDVITDLCGHAVIAASGADTAALLQGQLTNDIAQVSETRTQLSAWCSIKGRVLALFRIWRSDAVHYYLELPDSRCDAIVARLRRYVLRSEVSFEDGSEDSVRFGVSGHRAAEDLRQELGPLPCHPDEARRSRGCTVIRLRGEQPRFQIIAPLDPATALWERCRTSATPVRAPAWTLLDVRAGLVSIPASLSDRFLPQMLNLQALNGLSFDKGCYAGQEIIARTQYLGRLKRRLHRAALRTSSPAAPGDALYAESGNRDQPVGQVVSAAPSEHPGEWELLAVISDEAATDGLRLHHALGPALELRPLPCSLDPEAA